MCLVEIAKSSDRSEIERYCELFEGNESGRAIARLKYRHCTVTVRFTLWAKVPEVAVTVAA